MSWLRVVATAMLLLLGTTSCGLSVDESPRAIAADDLPEELRLGRIPRPTPQAGSASGPGSEQVHMVQDNRLVTVQRQILDAPEPLLETLLLGTFPEERAEGIRSALDFNTQVQSVVWNELLDLVIVDLAPGSLDPRNSEQRVAFAQIVYTLTSLPGIESVQFVQTDPENPSAGAVDLAVQTDGGTTLPGARVTREDFALLNPNAVPQPAFDIPVVTPTPTPDPNAAPQFELPIWLLDDDDKLVQVIRRIERTPNGFLVALIEGPTPDERNDGVRSAIPPDALPNPIEIQNFDVEVDEVGDSDIGTFMSTNIALVDLAGGSLPTLTEENELFLAAAQIVFTLTDLEEIDQVVFFIDGVAVPMPTDRGGSEDDLGLSLPFDPAVPRGLDKSDYQSAVLRSTEPGTIQVTPEPTPTPGS